MASLFIPTLFFFQINNPKTFLELVGPGNEAGLTANTNSLVSVQPSQVNKSRFGNKKIIACRTKFGQCLD